ncbi:unnamed protein product [Calypogeia fissa]
MKTSARRLGEEVVEPSSAVVFEHLMLGDIAYDIQQGDALKLHEIVHPRPYTLAIVDIPYGFSRSGCLHEDNVAWGVEEVTKLVQSFKVVTTAKLWRIIILHSIDQYVAVKTVLMAECNGGIQSCVWTKDNVKNVVGARLNNNFECFAIGFFSEDGSGTGLAAALALGRPCVAIELDARQSVVLRSRVLKLTDDLTRENEIKGVGDDGDDEEEDIEDCRDGGATEDVDGDSTPDPETGTAGVFSQ